MIGIFHPYFLPNNSVLTFVSFVSSLLITNFKISTIYFSYGETTQNVHAALPTGSGCSVGGLNPFRRPKTINHTKHGEID